MPIPLYLAMTAAEILLYATLPQRIGWMSCHFSPYGPDLTNLPTLLPKDSLLILDDSTPVCGHDPQRIADMLSKSAEAHACHAILLDLQRPGNPETPPIVEAICRCAPCPVGVSKHYWDKALHCALFLESPPLHMPIAKYLAPWNVETVWLEAAVDTADYNITEQGCMISSSHADPATLPHRDAASFCRYGMAAEENRIRFTLHRSKDDWLRLQESIQEIDMLIGLYQQLH